MQTTAWALLFCACAIAGCAAQASQRTGVPPPVPPPNLTLAQAKALDKSATEESLERYDAFVFFGAGRMLEAGDDQIKANTLLRDGIRGAVLVAKLALRKLFYNIDLAMLEHPANDPAFYDALVVFEQKAGLNVDGRFTLKEFGRLSRASDMADETRFWLPMKLVHSDSKSYVSATGTWMLQGEALAFPVNTVSIDCWRESALCNVYQTDIQIAKDDGDGGTAPLVFANSDYYDIESWSPNEVRAVTKTICRQAALTVQPATKTVFLTTTDLTAQGCPVIGRLSKPQMSTLEDPLPIMEKLFADRRAKVEALFFENPFERLKTLMQTQRPEFE